MTNKQDAAVIATSREEFVGWIADRFMAVHVPALPRDHALEMAGECLTFTELASKPFGHPDYDWSEGGAIDVANEDIEHWEG